MFRRLFGIRKPRSDDSAPGAPSIASALAHHRAGRLAEAEALYRRVLAADPQNIDASHFLGVIAYQRGDLPQAARWISAALARNGANAPAHNNLGNVLEAQGRHNEAFTCYLNALALEPDYVDALSNLGAAFVAQGKPDRAASCLRRALALAPDRADVRSRLEQALQARSGAAIRTRGSAADPHDADAHFDRGNAHKDEGRLGEARDCYEKSLALAPDLTAAYVNMGSVIVQQGRPGDALPWFRKALVLEPELPEALYNLGMAAFRAGDIGTAKPALARYLGLRPGDEPALLTLAEAHGASYELDEARACFERALAARPGRAGAHIGLGNVLRNQGRLADAIRHYRLALDHDPGAVIAFQNLLFCMMCANDHSARDVFEQHREFARRYEQPLLALHAPHANAPDPGRRLRVGYVSPDLRDNIVGHYVEPILRNHDRAGFEIHCYHTGRVRDAFSERLTALVDRWTDASALSDDAIAGRIREDRIDVLVDLCGHGAGNRILVFGRKPAPVQVSYLDYSATTGLASIDYRLTTGYCDPGDTADAYYSEKLYRLPGTYWTYNPTVRLPVSAPPSKANGHVTFGSFNLYYRITPEVLALWSRVLLSVPGARLVIVGVAKGSTERALRAAFAGAGVAEGRVSVHGMVAYEKYNELIGGVDIALAPFPYNGATTMMDCLWNGVPVVAMKGGETFYSRIGCSILHELALDRLIASDADGYVAITAQLAADARALAALRGSLREKMERSPMRDFAGFTRGLEAAYRSMWTAWCASRGA